MPSPLVTSLTEGSLWVWIVAQINPWANPIPQRLEGLPPVVKVACGSDFLVAEAEEGLWVLGNISKEQLGLGCTINTLQPTLVQVENCSEGPLPMLGCLLLWSNSHRLPRRRLLLLF